MKPEQECMRAWIGLGEDALMGYVPYNASGLRQFIIPHVGMQACRKAQPSAMLQGVRTSQIRRGRRMPP